MFVAQRQQQRYPVIAGLKPGMKVLDMGAGGGYSTELVARVIGPRNPFEARAAKPAMKNSVAVVRPYDDPLPADVHDLDVITYLFFYHDTTYLNVDRAQMNRKLFAALKPGGFLVIADHFAKDGSDPSVGRTLHRIGHQQRKISPLCSRTHRDRFATPTSFGLTGRPTLR